MALVPFAEKKLIRPGASDPRINARVGILHVDAGNAYDLHGFFNGPSGGIESHFHIPKDGKLFQYRDTDYEADANYRANPFALSFETQGFGTGEWTAEQLFTIKRAMLWAREVHDIPLRRCPSWDAAGWGYHIMFGAPGPWTPVSKACPGPDRIRQFNTILVPWMESGGRLEEEDDMPTPAELWGHRLPVTDSDTTLTAGSMLAQAHRRATDARIEARAAKQAAGSAQSAATVAADQAKRNRDAIAALGTKLEGIAPGVQAAVLAALGEEIKVTVDVRVPSQEGGSA